MRNNNSYRSGIKPLVTLLLGGMLAACSLLTEESGNSPLDWKLFRGDPGLSGYTATRLPQKPVLKWSYKGGVRTVSSPIVDDGTTYWSDRRGRILGVGLDGRLAFDYDLKTAVEATPMIEDSVLYIGRIDGNMTAISLALKDTLWNYETMGQISASPNLTSFAGRKAIVFGSYDNYLYCVDAERGEELNRFESGYYLNGAAALWQEHVLFGGCDQWLRVIDCRTGIATDSLYLEAYVPASPAISGHNGYVGDYYGNIYSFTLKEGKLVQHERMVDGGGEDASYVSVPAISDDALFLLSGERYVQSIDRKSGDTNWRYLLKGPVGESSPLVCRDKLMVCTKSGIVSILDAEKGTLLWEYDTGEQIVASPAVIQDHFFILTTKGTLFCFGKE